MTNAIPTVAVIGGGPAGLMAAEVLAQAGVHVELYDAMPSVGRKFLMAGKSGMNITHAEPLETLLDRYGQRRPQLAAMVRDFSPDALRAWMRELGIESFVGSSGRVFPEGMKAAPLLRAWLHRLRGQGVHFQVRHRWLGWGEEGVSRFETPQGEKRVRADALVLALGGGSWPQLGSNGAWMSWLAQRGVEVAPLRPANCGFEVDWTPHFREHYAGEPLKTVFASAGDICRKGDFVVSGYGIEGSLVYALSAALRDEIERNGQAVLKLDLLPDWPLERVLREVAHPRGSRSLSSHLQSRLGLKGVKAALLREVLSAAQVNDPALLSATIKALPLRLKATRPLMDAISSAGGVTFEAMDERLMLRALPGVFCAGEMLDWEAPTGGYLLTACFASGRAAAQGVLEWLAAR